MKKSMDLAAEVNVLGMLDKAREIYAELGSFYNFLCQVELQALVKNLPSTT